MKYTKIELKSWAVQLTEDNRIDIFNYFNDKHKNHFYNFHGINAYYGVKNDFVNCSDEKSDFEKILSFEEFKTLINPELLQTNIIENNYEIY
jgi:hypothetical protein